MVVLALVCVVFAAAWVYGTKLSQQPLRQESLLQDIHDTVASDTVTQYQIAKRNGNAIDICVQAGLALAAYLQAKNEPKYKEWKAIEQQDCRQAGSGN